MQTAEENTHAHKTVIKLSHNVILRDWHDSQLGREEMLECLDMTITVLVSVVDNPRLFDFAPCRGPGSLADAHDLNRVRITNIVRSGHRRPLRKSMLRPEVA